MSNYMDPDVQDELQAMSGSTTKVPLFGANRPLQKLSRPMQTTGNIGMSMNMPSSTQQSSRSLSPPPPPQPVLSTTDRATKMDLEAILRKPAHTPEEKLHVLEARDKLIRLTTAKSVDITKATRNKGVCPDICPEKERLSRGTKQLVERFESVDGSKSNMDHKIAVKAYSRSSADQETPLPHELRPEPVLKLTMTYLLQNIMDLCDDPDTSICDWYHFVWDRTRSIRKDITQQQLCTTESVLLLEQCARFHIHCAARLVAEEPQVFDQKINTENLTKCLQTLKENYHDLGLKMVRCPNEAEFRAYVVLLNLNDSSFLWEVKQLRDEIQQSPEIQFAIKAYLAIASNNYVRFFALVRLTTYMNACILLRYFTQVRVRALQVMFKAYAPRNAVYMSISNLTYLLGFEDFEQCAQFLEYYGLTCDRDEDRALLDRNSFYFPDMPFILDRAINLVEHKRHSSVGETVHGCPLDSKDVLEKYEPHDSFDENGVLLPRAWTAEDQNYYKPEARIEARRNKTPVSKEDESIFKMPMAPPKSSPKSRLSPKPIITSENAISASPNPPSIFGSSKFASSTQNANTSSGFFKTTTQAPVASGIFGGFAQSTPTTNLFGSESSATLIPSSAPKSKPFDSADGSSFKFGGSIAFGKPAENTAQQNSIFTGFSQKPTDGSSSFAQVKPLPKSSIFGNATPNVPPIFGGFGASDSSRASNSAGFMKQSNFQTTTSSNQSIGSNLFGGFKGTSTAIPGIKPLVDTDDEAKKLQREKEEARLKEIERKKREEEEKLNRQKQIELEEKERQRKKAEEEKKQRQLEQKRLEIEKTSTEIVESMIDEYVSKNLEEIASSEMKRHRFIEDAMNKIYSDILNEVIDKDLEEIAWEVKNDWDKNILEKYFAVWRTTTRKKIEQRRKIENTPVWMPNKSMKELIPELHHPLQTKTLGLMKRYRSGLPSKLIVPPIREDSIDLWNIVAAELIKLTEQIKGKQTQNIYWKCVISLPDSEEDSSSKSISQWLDNVFYRQVSKYPRQKDIFFVEQHDNNNQRLNICMRKLTGRKMHNELEMEHTTKDIEGTNAILFILSTKNMHATRLRIKSVLETIELNDATALIIYNLDSRDLNEVKNALNLHELIDYEKLNDCIFANGLKSRSTNNMCNLMKLGLKYVAANSFYDDQLEMQQTVSFLRICLADELWQRIYLCVSRNPTLLEASTQLDFLIDYHNEAIDRLVSVCTPTCIDSPTLFPPELRPFVPKHHLDIPLNLEYFPENWHETAEEHQQQLVEFLKSLKIQHHVNLKDVVETSTLESSILTFVNAHISSKFEAERTAYKMIQHLLAFLKPTQLNQLTFKEKLATYSWLDSFPIFTTDFLSFQYQRFIDEQRLPDYVIYDKCEYQDYIRNAWWLQTNEDLLKDLTVNVLRNIDVSVDEYEQTCKRQRLEETVIAAEEKQKFQDILAKGYAGLVSADKTLNRIKEIQNKCKDISKDLDYDLYKHEITMRDLKDQCKHFNE